MKDLVADPFGERAKAAHRRRFDVLGGAIDFSSNDVRLLRLAQDAFARLPRSRGLARPPMKVTLRLVPGGRPRRGVVPPRPRLTSGGGVLLAHIDADNFAAISVETGSALVQVSTAWLASAYHVRYELIELAALVLAARVQRLVPLHAALLGDGGRGLLVLGDSGAGKSTMTLCGLMDGLSIVSEDSVFVSGANGRATGVANFLHVGREALAFVDDARLRERIRASDTIRRRSGARKFEVDLRQARARFATAPLAIAAIVVLSARSARTANLLVPLSGAALVRVLRRTQPYATTHPDWPALERRLARRGGYRLLRGAHPRDSLRAARALLAPARSARRGRA